MVKPSLEKQPTLEWDATQNPNFIGEKLPNRRNIPAASFNDSGKNLGDPMVEMATPKRTKQSDRGNE
jgi:inner membrane protein involved in colicin E2 resistance